MRLFCNILFEDDICMLIQNILKVTERTEWNCKYTYQFITNSFDKCNLSNTPDTELFFYILLLCMCTVYGVCEYEHTHAVAHTRREVTDNIWQSVLLPPC